MYCDLIFKNDIKGRLACYADLPKTSVSICDFRAEHKPLTNDELKLCYISAGHILDQEFCLASYPTADEVYDCYTRCGLDIKRDRAFCEKKFLNDTVAKYDCLDQYSLPKLAEYCEGIFYLESQFDEKYECLANEGLPRTAIYCQEKFDPVRATAKLNELEYDPTEEIECITQLPDMPKLKIDCGTRNDKEADLKAAKDFSKMFHKIKSLELYSDLTDNFDEYFTKRVKS